MENNHHPSVIAIRLPEETYKNLREQVQNIGGMRRTYSNFLWYLIIALAGILGSLYLANLSSSTGTLFLSAVLFGFF